MFKCSFNDCHTSIEEKDGYCNGHNIDPKVLRNNQHLFQKKTIDNVSKLKAEIKYLKSKIKDMENAPPKCPQCNARVRSIIRTGKQINPSAMFDAASTIYEICPSCDFIYGYTY